MSPAILRGVIGSCLTLGIADLAWLDVNAERVASSDARAPTARAEPLAQAPRIERLRPLPAPSPIADEALPYDGDDRARVGRDIGTAVTTDSHPLPPQPGHCVVHFDRGVSLIRDDEAKTLAPIVDALKNTPKAIVRVDGHADRTGWEGNSWEGDRRSNLALSEQRAAAIVRALEKLGIPRERIRTAAFGDTRPVDDRSTEEAFRRNRRAEIRIELTGER